MAWETKGGCRFYTRSHRRHGRVVRDYLGTGLVAELAAQHDEEDRRGRRAQREQLRQEQAAFDAAAAPHRELSRVADALMTAALVAAGYHRHDRGAWRKRRVRRDGELPDSRRD